MRLKNLDLVVMMTIAAMIVVWAVLPIHFTLIGIILALPLVFVLPGYTLTEAMFYRRSLDASHRLIFSLGLSLAIDTLSGFVLNLLPGGLQAISWAVFLGLLTTVFSLLAIYLRLRTPVNRVRSLRFHLNVYGYLLFGLATMIAIFSVLYSTISAAQQRYPDFTQFWMLPAIQAEESCAVHLGIRNFESTSVTYRITMAVNGTQVTLWPSVVLAPQQGWNHLVPIAPGTAKNGYVEAQLYRLDKPQAVYREVHVTLYGCQMSQVSSTHTPTPYPRLVSAYYGTIHDIPANLTTKMSLTEVQQSGGNIHGYFTAGTGLQGSGSFKGMVTATKQIHFTVTNNTGHAPFSFEGEIDSDGNMAGSYCRFDQIGDCTGGYGLWSATPASP